MRRYEKKDAYKHKHPMLVMIFLWNVFRNFKLYAKDFANERYVVISWSVHLQGICWFVGLELVTNQESTF